MNKVRIILVLLAAAALTVLAIGYISRTANASDVVHNEAPAVADLPLGVAPAVQGPHGAEAFSSFSSLPSFPMPFFSFPFAVQGGDGNEGLADLNPINRSGIKALIRVQRIGRTETISGFATGMDPYKAYVALFYDAGSPGNGPCACIPSNPPPPSLQQTCKTTNAPPVNFSQMVIGYWLPLIGSATRTLHILKAGATDAPGGAAFVPLEQIGSVSVREDTQLGQPLPTAPDPARFQLRACGRFRQDQ